MDAFREIGQQVNAAWARHAYDNAVLADIAAGVLADSALCERVSVEDLCTWCIETEAYPRQPNELAMFGQPPMTIYADDQLYIEVLFWLEQTTTIHQHAFSGAFYVLAGPSIHSVYRFTEHDRLSPGLRLGEVELDRFERLQTGDVQPIYAGPSYIHALFHLGYPSVTVVVRNVVEEAHRPQYDYLRPSLAIDHHAKNVHRLRQRQVLEMLDHLSHPQAAALLDRRLQQAEVEDSVRLLLDMHGDGRLPADRLDAALAVIEARHGVAADRLRPVFREMNRVGWLVGRRQHVTDEGCRLFLALMILAPGREAAMDFIGQLYPGQSPAALVFGWIRALNDAGASLTPEEVQTMFEGTAAAPASALL